MVGLAAGNDLKLAVIFIGTNTYAKEQYFNRYFADAYVHILLAELSSRQRERSILRQCYRHGESFVVDSANLTKADRARYIEDAKSKGYRIIGYYFGFDERVEEELLLPYPDKDLLRAYNKMQTKFQMPEYSDGFDEIYSVTPMRSGEFKTEKQI